VKDETTGNLKYCLGNHVVLTTEPPGVPQDGESIATAYCFRMQGESGVGYNGREVPIGNRGPYGGTLVVAAATDKPIMTGNNCGGLIANAF
jgi:hypothetical protein